MKSLRFIPTLVVVVFLMAAIGSSAWAAGTRRPNIIFILTDDISPKDYAFYGGKTASSVLETMAKEGLYFKTAWATPKCMPTRAMLLTGKYAFGNKVFENQVNARGANDRTKIVVTNDTTVIRLMTRHDRLRFMAQGSSAQPQNALGGIDRGVEALVVSLRRSLPPALGAPTVLRASD